MDIRDRGRARTALVVAAVAVVMAVAVSRVPLQGIFLLGVALMCPLLMIGMHAGGHHLESGHADAPAGSQDRQADEPSAHGVEVDRSVSRRRSFRPSPPRSAR
jgi:hypothetical protein